MSNDPRDWKQMPHQIGQSPTDFSQNYYTMTDRRIREIAREEVRKEAGFTRGNTMTTEVRAVDVSLNGDLKVTINMGFGDVNYEVKAPMVQEAIKRLLEIQPNLSDIIARALQMRMKE